MNFCLIRLGKSSINEINKLDALSGQQLNRVNINIECKQVPAEVSKKTFCFIWLGSDNNKGLPTVWKQGLRAFGVVTDKSGGPRYQDDWILKLKIFYVFSSSVTKAELLDSSPHLYKKISEMPVIGLNTSSNQTVQVIKSREERQNINVLFKMLDLLDPGFINEIRNIDILPELVEISASEEENLESLEDVPEASLKENTDVKNNDHDFEEIEDKGTAVISHPFDPTKIDIRPQPLTIVSIIKRLASDPMRIDLDTEFQRTADLWTWENQSRLIESLLVRIPLPAFYFDGTSDKWLIVDGLQRISALRNFILLKKFKLTGLEYLSEFQGCGWDDLPPYLQTRIEETAVTAYIINPGTPEEVKFNIFKRINTGGLSLTPQEIRNALNQGVPSKFVAKLASEELFIQAMGGRVPKARMEDKDYVTRFVGFYLDENNYQPDLDSFLNAGMSKLKTKTEEELERISSDFNKAMKFAFSIFGSDAFRKKNTTAERRMPINKALFECTSVILAKLKYSELLVLEAKRQIVNASLLQLMGGDQEFIRSISSGTGDPKSVRKRYSALRTLFNNIIYDKPAAS